MLYPPATYEPVCIAGIYSDITQVAILISMLKLNADLTLQVLSAAIVS